MSRASSSPGAASRIWFPSSRDLLTVRTTGAVSIGPPLTNSVVSARP